MKRNSYSINLRGCIFCFFLLAFFSFQSNAYPAASSYYDTVQKIFIGYYQRPADPGGLIYWADRLDKSGGNLNEIIEAFANSAESRSLYGTINSGTITTVVNSIYITLFGRPAESGGLSFYVNGFNTGTYTAATIMLNVLSGAQNEDLQSVNNKLAAANLFTRSIDPELDGSNFQVTYSGDGDAIAARNFLTLYATSVKVPTQAKTTAYIKTNIANPGDPIGSPSTPLVETLGILEGSVNYPGPYPSLGKVTYTGRNSQTVTVNAFPGQVQVFFSTTTSKADAQSDITANGGTVIGKIPVIGYYLVQVTVGSEGAFITVMLANSQVHDAFPNIALSLAASAVEINPDYLNPDIIKYVPLNITGPVIIDSGDHAIDVANIFTQYGGATPIIVNSEYLYSYSPDGEPYIAADKMQAVLMAITQGNAIYNSGDPLYVNMSLASGYHDNNLSGDTNGNGDLKDWSNYANLPTNLQAEARLNYTLDLVGLLLGLQGLPTDLYNNIFITKAAGNNNMPMDSMLDIIENDPSLGRVLKEKIAIVSTNFSSAQPNYVTKYNHNVVVMNNPEAAGGTSFAAPALLPWLQLLKAEEIRSIMTNSGATLTEIALATKLAVETNANKKLVLNEVIDKANNIVSSAGTDSLNASRVTGIAFTSIGGTTTAIITPVFSLVTVMYTVSGTDGYYDSGSLGTSSSGTVSFGIPAGAPGVVDTISVTAVLSGKTATAKYTW